MSPLPPGALVRVKTTARFNGIRRVFAGRVGTVVAWDRARVVVDFASPRVREAFRAHQLEPADPAGGRP